MADRPWIFRTYSGHSTARASNALYRSNLAKGQTGLSIAFDLPTQTGYDADHPLAAGEVGKVGVPIAHIDDMDALFEGIPLGKMNTSMTINATAAWLLALYVAVAERHKVPRAELQGTTQNDIVKEYLSRGTYIFPPRPSLLTRQIIEWTVAQVPKWNPINVCSYHLQEVGATPVQEVAFTLANAMAVRDSVRVAKADLGQVFGRISFFCNAGIRFIEEVCKLRAFGRMWDKIGLERYGVVDKEMRRFRYGVQVNSLGLTEAQPENNVPRIALEALGVTLSRDARCRALQLPAWNEALGLPRPWDQQWSLRIQQILAFETDMLEYGDIFEGSVVIERKTAEIEAAAWQEIQRIEQQGGAIAAVESGYMKQKLVESNARRVAEIEAGTKIVVGVNKFTEGEPSPSCRARRRSSPSTTPRAASRSSGCARTAPSGTATRWKPRCAAARGARGRDESDGGVGALRPRRRHHRRVVRRAARGVRRVPRADRVEAAVAPRSGAAQLAAIRARVDEVSKVLGRRLKLLVGKPGLDGHSSGAEQIAIFARDAGMEVVYEGIRLTPDEIVNAALQEGVHLIGLSILSGSHLALAPEIARRARIPVIVGGIIPEEDAEKLRAEGVAAVYTPRDYDVLRVLREMVEIAAAAHGAA
jgi:(2R)-ethylmalonyl-CoA mutase